MLGKKNAVRLRRLLDVMIPILITQTAIMAMNFCDSAMSGMPERYTLRALPSAAICGCRLWRR